MYMPGLKRQCLFVLLLPEIQRNQRSGNIIYQHLMESSWVVTYVMPFDLVFVVGLLKATKLELHVLLGVETDRI